jgi:hypothetical protein
MPKSNKIAQNKKALLTALEKSLGVVTQACKIAGISRRTFYEYVNKDAEFAQAVKDVQNIALDFAESQLFKQIQDGNTTATIFYLKTKGKHRGYIEKIEAEASGDITIRLLPFE